MAFAPGGNRGTPEAPQTAGLDRPTLSRAAYRPRCANLLSESQLRVLYIPSRIVTACHVYRESETHSLRLLGAQRLRRPDRPTITRSERSSSRSAAVLLWFVAAYTAPDAVPDLNHSVVTLPSVEIDELCLVSPLSQ